MSDRELNAFIEATAKALQIDLSSADQTVVRAHLAIAVKMADLLANLPLDDRAEPAPVFAA